MSVVAACTSGGGGGATPARTAAPRPEPARRPAENVAFWYLPVTSTEQMRRLGPVRLVVAGPQNIGRPEAAAHIRAAGPEAYLYQQTYWFPLGRRYQGLRIDRHPEWAFCLDGDTPLTVRRRDGRDWWYLDMNERAVQEHLAAQFAELRRQGWDGVFFDRGLAALTGYGQEWPPTWYRTSSCTEDPVRPGATFADTWIDVSALVRRAGLKLIVNYGQSPFDPRVPMRPDPRDPRCVERAPGCRRLDDGWEHPNLIADEAVAHPRDADWANDFAANRFNEQDPLHAGRVIGLITAGTLGGDLSRDNVYFQWARVKLFAFPLGVAVWDREAGCRQAVPGEECPALATYPELTGVPLGRPLDPLPRAEACAEGTQVNCVWSRRYREGGIVVNVSDRAVPGHRFTLGTRGCRWVRDVWAGAPLAGNRCVSEVTLDLPPWSGRPLAYRDRPW